MRYARVEATENLAVKAILLGLLAATMLLFTASSHLAAAEPPPKLVKPL
jgi:hypothetical protein